jgi:ankyrin repeat protein
VEYLLVSGADVNMKNWRQNTPLHEAAYKNRDEIGRVLLTAGADIHAENYMRKTPLQVAQDLHAADMIRLLDTL